MGLYVGQRYIPKHCGEWDSGRSTTYETLSVVFYNGDSYTSKKNVPKGIDILDRVYWEKSSDYNAQMQNYELELQAFTSAINTLVTDYKNATNTLVEGYKTSVDSHNALIDTNNELRLIGDNELRATLNELVLEVDKAVADIIANRTHCDSMLAGVNTDILNTIALAKAELEGDDNAIIQMINQKLSSVYKPMGSKNTFADLPSTGQNIGDVWNVITGTTPELNGINYVWNGNIWDSLGGNMDMSRYYIKTEIDNLLSGFNTNLLNSISLAKAELEGDDNAIIQMIQNTPLKVTPSLQHNWVAYDTNVSTPKYYKELNQKICFKGSIKNGDLTTGTVIFTLPEGYRPSEVCTGYAHYLDSDVVKIVQINISTNGDVMLTTAITANTQLTLDGIYFLT